MVYETAAIMLDPSAQPAGAPEPGAANLDGASPDAANAFSAEPLEQGADANHQPVTEAI